MTVSTVVSPSYEHWNFDVIAGDSDLWSHLNAMERGDEGDFSQALYKALEHASGSNRRTLYNSFFHLFNPSN